MVALVIQNDIENLPQNITVIKVGDSRKAMAVMASKYYGDIAKKLKLIEVTGTNGKTSITYFISNVLKNFGVKCGVIGTIENSVDGEILKTERLNPITPDSLENVLKIVREISKGKTILAFGCGGNRDKEKRAIMGEIARKYSDYCVITSDNPRSENPRYIIEDIAMGLGEDRYRYEEIEDRKEAINKALSLAKEGDVVIIAGKGHENYQIFKEKTIHFSDYEVIEEYFINKTT